MSDEVVKRLWLLAELEAGVEQSKIEREPKFGSEAVVDVLADVHDRCRITTGVEARQKGIRL